MGLLGLIISIFGEPISPGEALNTDMARWFMEPVGFTPENFDVYNAVYDFRHKSKPAVLPILEPRRNER